MSKARKPRPRQTWSADPTEDEAYPFQEARPPGMSVADMAKADADNNSPAPLTPGVYGAHHVSWGQIKATYRRSRPPEQDQED